MLRHRAWLVLALCACAAPPALQPGAAKLELPAALRALRYTVRPDAALSRLAVELCFEGQPPERLIYGGPKAVTLLREPRVRQGGPLRVEQGRIMLAGLAADSCIEYWADVRAALDHDSLLLAYPGEEALMFGTELFLWRPPRRSPQLQATLRFELPPGMQVSTPWPEAGAREVFEAVPAAAAATKPEAGAREVFEAVPAAAAATKPEAGAAAATKPEASAFVLDESAFAFTGHLVLGRFEPLRIPAPGSSLRAVIMPGFPSQARAAITPWLERSAGIASLPGGFFPVPHAQVIVVPTSPSAFPIYFGHTGRSGGASIVLFLPTDAGPELLHDDWIAVHEFSHLWHPFIAREDAWLSEGLATYLQELLRTRAGIVTAEQLWQRLHEGALRGRETDQSLQHETRIMPFAHNYQRVYWAGAAIALMIDVELRRASRGEMSLERALGLLRRDPARFAQVHSARELLRALDAASGVAVCEPLAERHLTAPRFPELSALYGELGVSVDARGQVTVTRDAPLAWVREAIALGGCP